MPAAAGDGLLGEPPVGGGEDAARPAAAFEGSFLPAWVSGVPRERLRDFQHHKRVGNYLVGSRKLGEGSFAKVREGLHVLTGEKVSHGRGALPGAGVRSWGPWGVGRGVPAAPAFTFRTEEGRPQGERRPLSPGTAFSGASWVRPRGEAGSAEKPPAALWLLEGRRLADTSAGWGARLPAGKGWRSPGRQEPGPRLVRPRGEGGRAD